MIFTAVGGQRCKQAFRKGRVHSMVQGKPQQVSHRRPGIDYQAHGAGSLSQLERGI